MKEETLRKKFAVTRDPTRGLLYLPTDAERVDDDCSAKRRLEVI